MEQECRCSGDVLWLPKSPKGMSICRSRPFALIRQQRVDQVRVRH